MNRDLRKLDAAQHNEINLIALWMVHSRIKTVCEAVALALNQADKAGKFSLGPALTNVALRHKEQGCTSNKRMADEITRISTEECGSKQLYQRLRWGPLPVLPPWNEVTFW
jgi:hypothetical protein